MLNGMTIPKKRVPGSRKYVYEMECLQCGNKKYMRKGSKFCSTKCNIESQKGVPRDKREKLRPIPASVPKRFNDQWVHDIRTLDGAPVVLTCDWHLPYHDEEWVEKMTTAAESLGAKRLYIVGDYTDQHGLSKYADLTGEDLVGSIKIIQDMFAYLLDIFDDIYWIVGNHDMRIVHQLQMKLGLDTLHKLFVPQDHKRIDHIHFTTYPYAWLKYGDSEYDKWLLVHPREYRKVSLSAAKDLATVHLSDIYNTHGHTIGTGRHPSGRFAIIDGGGMFDQEKIEYKNTQVTTHPMWGKAFAIVWGREFIQVDDRFPMRLLSNEC